MSDINQVLDTFKKEMTNLYPSGAKIISQLNDIKSRGISDTEFYEIIGQIFKLNPQFFMTSIYPNKKMLKWQNSEMVKYIVEKYCLYKDEKIIYEFFGSITEISKMPFSGRSNLKISIKDSIIMITDQRIIAQGKISVKGGGLISGDILDILITPLTGGSKREKSIENIINYSVSKTLPCYGYQFKLKYLFGIPKKDPFANSVIYSIFNDSFQPISGNSITSKQLEVFGEKTIKVFTPKVITSKIFEILFNVEQIIDGFLKLQALGLNKRVKATPYNFLQLQFKRKFLGEVMRLWATDDYKHFSDLEKINILIALYELDPELFMWKIYPKMKNWNYPTFLTIKDDLLKKLRQQFLSSSKS